MNIQILEASFLFIESALGSVKMFIAHKRVIRDILGLSYGTLRLITASLMVMPTKRVKPCSRPHKTMWRHQRRHYNSPRQPVTMPRSVINHDQSTIGQHFMSVLDHDTLKLANYLRYLTNNFSLENPGKFYLLYTGSDCKCQWLIVCHYYANTHLSLQSVGAT